MAARVSQVVTIANTPKGILDYLVQRTADTIGEQVARSQAVIVGSLQQTEPRTIAIRPQDAVALEPWRSGEAGVAPGINIFFTGVRVERWLVGRGEASQIEIAYAGPRGTGGVEFFPSFNPHDRGLLFLRELPSDLPYASYIQGEAYQLAAGEKGVRGFEVTDYDAQGEPYTRDETADVKDTIAAVEWYAALPTENDDALRQALLRALDDPNPRVVRHAIRTLGAIGDSTAAQELKARLPKAPDDLRIRLMLGLWMLGERDYAKESLEQFFRENGKYLWLAGWGIEPTLVDSGRAVDTLYGPEPNESKGD